MKDIIEWIAIFCFPSIALKSTSRYILSSEEQYSLIINGNYRQCKKAMKRQKFDDEPLKCLASNLLCKHDENYKLLMFHYKTFGFSLGFERFMVESWRPKGFRPFLMLMMDEYGIAYKKDFINSQFFEAYTCLWDILKNNNQNIATFFKKAKNTEDLLKAIKSIYLNNKVLEECGPWVPYPASSFGELFYNIFAYQGIIPLTEKEQKSELLKVFPSHESQQAIMAMGNMEWIKKLEMLASLTQDVWMEAFGEFDDTILAEETKEIV